MEEARFELVVDSNDPIQRKFLEYLYSYFDTFEEYEEDVDVIDYQDEKPKLPCHPSMLPLVQDYETDHSALGFGAMEYLFIELGAMEYWFRRTNRFDKDLSAEEQEDMFEEFCEQIMERITRSFQRGTGVEKDVELERYTEETMKSNNYLTDSETSIKAPEGSSLAADRSIKRYVFFFDPSHEDSLKAFQMIRGKQTLGQFIDPISIEDERFPHGKISPDELPYIADCIDPTNGYVMVNGRSKRTVAVYSGEDAIDFIQKFADRGINMRRSAVTDRGIHRLSRAPVRKIMDEDTRTSITPAMKARWDRRPKIRYNTGENAKKGLKLSDIPSSHAMDSGIVMGDAAFEEFTSHSHGPPRGTTSASASASAMGRGGGLHRGSVHVVAPSRPSTTPFDSWDTPYKPKIPSKYR